MLTLDERQIRHLAQQPDVLGAVLMRLAEDAATTGAQDWCTGLPDGCAARRMGDVPMTTWINHAAGITLAISTQGPLVAHAHGAGWEIELPRDATGWRRIGGGFDHQPEHREHLGDDPPPQGDGMSDPPRYVSPDFDWPAQIAATPTLAICRIHMVARSMNMEWDPEGVTPTGAMVRSLRRADAALKGDASSETRAHTLGAAVDELEISQFGETRESATDGTVHFLMDELGFDQDEGDGRRLGISGGTHRMRAKRIADGWRVDLGIVGGADGTAWTTHAQGMSPAAALRRIHALSHRMADAIDATSPSDAMLAGLARDCGAEVGMDGSRMCPRRTATAVLRALGVSVDPAMVPDEILVAALRAAYGRDLEVLILPF
jgi:hypothetical protein